MRPAPLVHLLLTCLTAGTVLGQSEAPLRYSCFADHILYDKWLKDPKRSVAPEGYYRYEKRFHPLSVATGGILAYEHFMDTGDSAYFRTMRDQVRYFSDTARVDTAFSGNGLGIPYDWAFGQLKAPWYSGMTQGVVLSLLIRYEHLTGDPAMEPLIRKIAFFMLRPERAGGCLSTTKEGHTWIEEYPRSTEHRHVLNGFINALIGLHEYSARYPDDTLASRVATECQLALRNCFDHYDKVEWSTYDRSGNGLTAGYMEYQILELKQLLALAYDPLIHEQLLLWTVFASERPNNEKALHMRKKGWRPSAKLVRIDSMDMVPDIRFDDPQKGRRMVMTAGRPKPTKAFRKGPVNASRTWTLAHQLPVASIVELIELVHDTFPQPIDIAVWTRDTINGHYHEQRSSHLFAAVDRLHIRIPPVATDHIVMRINASSAFMPDTARIQLRIGAMGPDLIPWNAHERVGPLAVVPEEPYRVIVAEEHAADATVFYRTGSDLKSIRKTPWRARNRVEVGSIFVTDKSFVEFLVVHELKDPLQTFRRSVVNRLSVPAQ
ncbi:MAG: hypothetical protein IT229_07970 [Flavobacteriales bacterium]|nr:hypothetical protein [Flavobacteriales bacterium]